MIVQVVNAKTPTRNKAKLKLTTRSRLRKIKIYKMNPCNCQSTNSCQCNACNDCSSCKCKNPHPIIRYIRGILRGSLLSRQPSLLSNQTEYNVDLLARSS